MEKKVVIISNSLTNDFVSPKEKFLKVDINVGLTEINRLFGEGENYSLGPLPEYLHHAIRGKRDGKPILHILLRDLHDPDDPIQQPELLRFGNHNLMGTDGAAFADPIQELAVHSEIINTHALSLPVYDFHRFMDQYLEKDILSLTPDEQTSVYFIITGVYTNVRVFNIAARIRCDYEFPNVFVCPHLVGSKYHQAHLSTLQIGLPNALVHVIPSLQQIYEITGIKKESRTFRQYDCCRIEPESVKRELDHDAKQIIETIFMFNSTVRLKPLSGGFSGGMLFWVEGRKRGAKSEPEVLKIDTHEKMHREIQGYNLVKALLGKTIPSFSQPVFHGKYTGIKMELAAMEGEPDTLQSKFEKIQQIKEFEIFLDPYESIIKKLQTSVYENTTHTTKIYPYKAFGLHTDQQKIWLGENISHILPEVLSDAQGLRERRCSTGKLRFDDNGKPLNPKGRTGIQGRGLLGKWGPNYAVDPVITRINPVNGDLEVVLVKRADTGEWGLPGAIMVEDESFMQSAKRALEVKTKSDFDFSRATLLGQMYIDDYRNTDNAWMESYAVHLHLTPKEIKTIKLKEGFGIQDAAWVSITPEVVNRLFANHSEIIKMVLEKLLESGEPVVDHSAVKNILLNI